MLSEDKLFHAEYTRNHKLVLIGESSLFEIIRDGKIISRKDLETKHEEADHIIIQQVMICAQSSEQTGITVISNDTDVFVLLLHYCHKVGIKHCITMESPIKDRATIDISKTVEKHTDIIGEILPVYALTGCHTVACCYGVGKGTALKVLKAGIHSLALLGQVDVPIESVIHQANAFMSANYGCSSSKLMPKTRLRLWASKTGSASSSALPKLQSFFNK
jgi:hypothetical protein